MSLRNLFRRQAEAPTLRDRAFDLRASLAASRPQPAPLPAPGSEEARVAWHAACHQYTIRTAALHDCPELMRGGQDVWTTQSLGKALETGEITVTDYARLHPLASERELRFAEIAHELNIGGLFALAYAGEYPVKAQAPDAEAVEAEDTVAEHCPSDLIAAADLSLKSLPVFDLCAILDAAETLSAVASAITCQPRLITKDSFNGAGILIESVAFALHRVINAVAEELRCRTPNSASDQAERLATLARLTIHNDDQAETAAFARELLTHVEAERERR